MERPENLTIAAEGSLVELRCLAEGSPRPQVTWRRLDGLMPLGRANQQRLLLEQVSAQDSGSYVCEAENAAGVASVSASLRVVSPPRYLSRPQDLRVLAGGEAELGCRLEGDPPPLLLWRTPTRDHTPLLPRAAQDNLRVSEDGHTLRLTEVTPRDSGYYYCWGISDAGGISSVAELTVVSAHPPPVVGVGPQDLGVAPGGVATFPCEVVSEATAASVSWWFRAAVHLPERRLHDGRDRTSLAANGALILKEVRPSDAGIYSCHIESDSGNMKQEAVLRVDEQFRGHEEQATMLPPPPTKPRISVLNATAVRLNWFPNSQVLQGSALRAYAVEYWRQGWDEWRIADTLIPGETCVVGDLSPASTYTFLVRAVSASGSSFPSPWSDPVSTQASKGATLSEEDFYSLRKRLSKAIVSLQAASLVQKNKVRLTWRFLSPEEPVEGVLVYALSGGSSIQVATVLGAGGSSSHLLRDLSLNTRYTFFVVPFWSTMEGTPSNSHTLTTPQDGEF